MSLVFVLFVLVVVAVALVDAAVYRIPNLGLIVLCVLFVAVAAIRGAGYPLLGHFGAGALSLAVGIVLFAAGQVGAGDAKLFATLSLWSGFTGLIPLLFFVALGGLVQLAVILSLRRIVPVLQHAFPRFDAMTPPRILTKREGIPFGVGIVMGAIVAARWFPHWLWLGHFSI